MRLRSLLFLVLSLPLPALSPTALHASTTPAEAAAIASAQNDHTAYTLSPAALATAESLATDRHILYFAGLLWSLLSLLLVLELGLAARMRNVANNLSKKRPVQASIFFLELLILLTLLGLPIATLEQHVSRVFGLSVQSWPGWLGDQLKIFAITLLLGTLGVILLFNRIRRYPRTWWLWISGIAMVFTVVGVLITPYVIDPLFNHFEPLAQSDPALVQQLERVVARGGKSVQIPPERMFLMRASSKVTTLNAYVTGFGASKRVVVWDTSIQKGTTDEILFIFGHEMGHYVLGHVVTGILFACGVILVSFFLGFHLFQFLLRRFGTRWRIPAQDNWAALVLLLLVLGVLNFFTLPIESAFSRADEHAADVFGQEAVHGIIPDPQATAQATFQLLGQSSYSLPNPNPFFEFWTGSHPPTWFRAAFARHYNPWAPGAQPKYLPESR